jgi:hypothetical protein
VSKLAAPTDTGPYTPRVSIGPTRRRDEQMATVLAVVSRALTPSGNR